MLCLKSLLIQKHTTKEKKKAMSSPSGGVPQGSILDPILFSLNLLFSGQL